MTVSGPHYEFKVVRTLRRREARTTKQWQGDGWELVSRNQRGLHAELAFGRVTTHRARRPWLFAAALTLSLLIGAAVIYGSDASPGSKGWVSGDMLAPLRDEDGDGIPDQAEVRGWLTLSEDLYRTDPANADTDGDGLSDGDEAGQVHLTSSRGRMYDGRSDPTNVDSDGDFLDDATEREGDLDPWAQDSDDDDVDDLVEIDFGSDPLAANADGDHFDDDEEMTNGSDPNIYDLTGTEAAAALAGGFTFGEWPWGATNIGRLNDAQRDSWQYLTGAIASGFVPLGDLRDAISNLSSSEWGAAIESIQGAVPVLGDASKVATSAADFARRGGSATRAALYFFALTPQLTPAQLQAGIRQLVRLAPDNARLDADATVWGTDPPPPLLLERPVSTNYGQNLRKDEIIKDLETDNYTDLRVNQQQVDADGRLVGMNRVDVQATAPDGTRHYFVLSNESSDLGKSHLIRILSNDDSGEVHLFNVASRLACD